MDNNKKSETDIGSTPAFEMQWQQGTTQAREAIYWELTQPGNRMHPGSRLRNALASLHAGNTHVEVSDMDWATPITLQFTPNRVGFSTLVSSSASVEYGYTDEEKLHTTSVGKILFFLPGREILA